MVCDPLRNHACFGAGPSLLNAEREEGMEEGGRRSWE